MATTPSIESAQPGSSPDLPVIKLTPSRGEDFLACPRRYQRLHINGLRPKERPTSRHLALGTSLHEALRHFYEGGGFPVYGPEALPRLLARSWVPEGYADGQEAAAFRAEALAMLEAYYEAYRAEPTRHLGHELFVQATFRLSGMKVLLSGKIDRLSVWPDGRLEVIDYKTNGGAPPSPEKLASDLAPFLYYAIARLNFREHAAIDVSFIYLKTLTKVTARFDGEALAEGKARLAGVVRQIEEGFFPPRPNGHCAWCEVRDDCPAMCREEVDLDEVL